MSAEGEGRSARRALVSGRVQGVAFRYYARERARELGLCGWVRNLCDGRVEVHVEGPPEEVERLVAWLREGPSSARVDSVELQSLPPEGLAGFEIAR